jgi:uncharacterized membrane protein YccC
MDPTSEFLRQGLLGVIIVVLAGVVVWQQKRIDNKDRNLEVMAQKRVEDIVHVKDAYSNQIENIRDAQVESTATIQRILDTMVAMSRSVEQLVYKRGRQ